jgi:hypothetical protein
MLFQRTVPGGLLAPAHYGGVLVGDPKYSDRFGWPVDDLSTPTFDWADGDDTAPAQGPTLTKAGTPSSPTETPWTLYNGNTVTCTSFAQGEHYRSSTATDPTSGHDYVVVALLRAGMAATSQITGTRTNGVGWQLYYTTTQVALRSQDAVANVISSSAVTADTWYLIGVTYDASGDQYLYVDGSAVDNDTVSALGDLGSGLGIGVNANPAGNADEAGCVARVVVWYGSGIAATADAAWHAEVNRVVNK